MNDEYLPDKEVLDLSKKILEHDRDMFIRLSDGTIISKRTLAEIDESVANFKKGIVSDPIDLSEF